MSSPLKRKRGRPRKIKQEEEEKQESSSKDDTFRQSGSGFNPTSPRPASATPSPLKVSRYQTRYSKALVDNEERLEQPDGMPTEAYTSPSPVQPLERHSQQGNVCPDNNLPEMEATADRNLETHDRSTFPLACDMPNNALVVYAKPSDNNEDISFPQPDNSFVEFNGYKVKKEILPLLNDIFIKYGDIAKNSMFSMESRPCLLEIVCSIFKRLKASKFMQLTPLELQSMLEQIGDLELVKVDVRWLHKRLFNISKARELCNDVLTLKDAQERTRQDIDERKKSLENFEEELENCMAIVKKLQEKVNQEERKLTAAMALMDELKEFCEGSLVKGLL